GGFPGAHRSGASPRVEGEVEVEEHEDAGLGVDTQERNQPHPDGDARVVAEEIEEPDGAHRRERHDEKNDHRLYPSARFQVQQDEVYEVREWDDEVESRGCLLEVSELPHLHGEVS